MTLDYITDKVWTGENSNSTVYKGLYCIIYDDGAEDFHYRIQYDPYDYEYIVCETGFKSFSEAESHMMNKAEYLRKGGISLMEAEQKLSSKRYL